MLSAAGKASSHTGALMAAHLPKILSFSPTFFLTMNLPMVCKATAMALAFVFTSFAAFSPLSFSLSMFL